MKHLFFIIICILSTSSVAQNTQETISTAEKKEVIDSIVSILNQNYIFPDIAEKVEKHLKKQWQDGVYSTINKPQNYADILTKEVQSVNGDKHLRVSFSPESIARRRQANVTSEDSLAMIERNIRYGKRNNFGFQEVKILTGNIGYLDLRGFYDTEYGGPTASAAMNLLSNTDGLIIDLRQNGGGSPSMIQLITSYLYGPESVHLNNFYWRPSDQHTQTWTLPYVPGNRRPDLPVYVLTSNRTFSAAEEFSYNLRNLDRATLIGETTGGGAHPGGTRIATDRFTIWVPTGRAINPITNTNWEGTGVKPHIEVPAIEAFDVAYIEALKGAMENVPENEKIGYTWAIENVKAKQTSHTISSSKLKKYAGDYGPRKITYRDGQLFYSRDGGNERKLSPMDDTTFMLEGSDDFRIKIILQEGVVTGLEGHYMGGRVDHNKRDRV